MTKGSRTILVTGATGFVGRHIVEALANRGVEVVALVRSLTRLEGLPEAVQAVQVDDLFRAPEEELFEVFSALPQLDAVIHAAWFAVPGEYLTSSENVACLEGTIRLAQITKAMNCRRFVGIGTCFEYDLTQRVLSTDTDLAPTTLYAAAKSSAFIMLTQLLKDSSTLFSWCRLFYLFGPHEDPRRLVPYVRRQLEQGLPVDLTTGSQIRDFMDVRDAADIISAVALSDHEGPFNVCSGVPITVRKLAESIADEYGRRDLLRFGARPDNLTDPPCVLGVPLGLPA